MKMRTIKNLLLCAGIFLLLIGITSAILLESTNEILNPLSFVMISMGTGCIGAGLSFMGFSKYLYPKDPQLIKEIEIEEKDERNIRLREKAGYSSWIITQFVLTTVMLTFVILGYTVPSWFVVAALFIHNFSFVISLGVQSKKM